MVEWKTHLYNHQNIKSYYNTSTNKKFIYGVSTIGEFFQLQLLVCLVNRTYTLNFFKYIQLNIHLSLLAWGIDFSITKMSGPKA